MSAKPDYVVSKLTRPTGGAATGGFVINLTSSTTPMALSQPKDPTLSQYTFFVSRRLEDGRERFRLHMGYFESQQAAEEMLVVVRDVYPGAWASEAPGKKLKANNPAPAAAAAPARAAAPAQPKPVTAPVATAPKPAPVAPPVAAAPKPAPVAPPVAAAPPPPAPAAPEFHPFSATPPPPVLKYETEPEPFVLTDEEPEFKPMDVPVVHPPAKPVVSPPARAAAKPVPPKPAPPKAAAKPVAKPAPAKPVAAKPAPRRRPAAPARGRWRQSRCRTQAGCNEARRGNAAGRGAEDRRQSFRARAASRGSCAEAGCRRAAAEGNRADGADAGLDLSQPISATPSLTNVRQVIEELDDLSDTQTIRLLERHSPYREGSREADVDEAIRVIKPEDTQSMQAIKAEVKRNAPVLFAVQLDWSVTPFDHGEGSAARHFQRLHALHHGSEPRGSHLVRPASRLLQRRGLREAGGLLRALGLLHGVRRARHHHRERTRQRHQCRAQWYSPRRERQGSAAADAAVHEFVERQRRLQASR